MCVCVCVWGGGSFSVVYFYVNLEVFLPSRFGQRNYARKVHTEIYNYIAMGHSVGCLIPKSNALPLQREKLNVHSYYMDGLLKFTGYKL